MTCAVFVHVPLQASVQCQTTNSSSTLKPISKDSSVLSIEWKRAIDQDNAEDLWRLLPHVDVKGVNEKGKTALMAAAKIGDRCLLESLVSAGLDIQDRSSTGGTALMYAVLGNDAEMIDYLLPYSDNIDAQSTNGWTAVMIAAAKGFDTAISKLVDAGADADLADVYRWSPLMRAIDNRHNKAVDYLLSRQMLDINHINENGSTALHIAATVGDMDTARQLKNMHADVNVLDKNGFSAEQIAVAEGHREIVKLLKQTK